MEVSLYILSERVQYIFQLFFQSSPCSETDIARAQTIDIVIIIDSRPASRDTHTSFRLGQISLRYNKEMARTGLRCGHWATVVPMTSRLKMSEDRTLPAPNQPGPSKPCVRTGGIDSPT